MVPRHRAGVAGPGRPGPKIQATPMTTPENREWDADAQTDRDYDSLTGKQRRVVDALARPAGDDITKAELADDAGVAQSYVHYVKDQFPHIVSERKRLGRVAADGSGNQFDITLSEQQVWTAIRSLPEDLSTAIFRQAYQQGASVPPRDD